MVSLKHSFEYLYKKTVRYAYSLASEESTLNVYELTKTDRLVWQIDIAPKYITPKIL